MNVLRLTLLLSLLLIAAATALEHRLGETVLPLRQSIELEVDSNGTDFKGRSAIALNVKEETAEIRLNARDLTINKAVLAGNKGSQELTPGPEAQGIVSLKADIPIPPGQYVLDLEFTGPYNRNSAGLYQYTDQGTSYLSTQFEMTDARRAFPCFDEPNFKIPYQLTVTAPRSQRVFTNTPEIETVEQGDRIVHRFEETPPLPSYLVALAVGPYESAELEGLGVPGRLVTTAGKLELTEYARSVTPTILQGLEDYFAIEYPYKKLDQVGVTEFPYGAMENAGMVTYREDILLLNPATAQLSDRTLSATIIAHELAHQWFGNLVTMKWWNDLWLNEAFANWLSDKIVADKFPQLESDLEPSQNHVMTSDAALSSKPIRKPIRTEADILDGLGLAYNKGQSVLNMVESWIGEETFQKGMRLYMHRHRFGNAEASDLWNVLGEVSAKDVETVLASFTEQAGYPLITLTPSGKSLQVTQKRFSLAGVEVPPQLWSVPMRVRYGAGGRVAEARFLLKGTESSVTLEFEPEWMMPDAGGIGYFRWNVPNSTMKSLLGNTQVLNDREKLAVLYNIDGLFKAGALTAGQSLNSVTNFLDDAHPTVVRKALGALDGYGQLYVNDDNRTRWRGLLAQTLAPVEQRFGLQARDGEHIKVPGTRNALIRLKGFELQDPATLAKAAQVTDLYLAGEEVDSATAETYLSIAAHYGEPALVSRVKKALVEAKDPQRRSTLLNTLGGFGQPEAHRKALDLMLDQALTPSDLSHLVFMNGRGKEERAVRLQDWLEANYPALTTRFPEAFIAYIPQSLSAVRDQQKLDRIVTFFSAQDDPNGAIARALVKLQESVRSAIEAQERGQKSFDEFLRSRSSGSQ